MSTSSIHTVQLEGNGQKCHKKSAHRWIQSNKQSNIHALSSFEGQWHKLINTMELSVFKTIFATQSMIGRKTTKCHGSVQSQSSIHSYFYWEVTCPTVVCYQHVPSTRIATEVCGAVSKTKRNEYIFIDEAFVKFLCFWVLCFQWMQNLRTAEIGRNVRP